MKASPTLRFAALVVATIGVFAVACHGDRPVSPLAAGPTDLPDGTQAAVPGTGLSALVPSGSVQVAIQQQPTAADGSITFIVRVVSNGVGVSAYQGAVTFAPGVLQLVSLAVPPGNGDEVYVVNPGDFAAGRLRFAACAATTFAGTDLGDGLEAFRFVVRPAGSLASANLTATLGVVGTETGAGLAAQRLLPSAGVLAATAAPAR